MLPRGFVTTSQTFRRVCAVLCGGVLGVSATGQTSEEYKVKAAFLYNFTKFVEWPPQTFRNPASQIVIGVLGRDPFGNSLVTAVAGKTVDGHSFQIRDVTEAAQAAGCQILFISSSERKRLPALLSEIGNPGILTVGEAEEFVANGGVINFKIEGGRVHLQINLEAARRQHLRISAKLLSLAEVTRN